MQEAAVALFAYLLVCSGKGQLPVLIQSTAEYLTTWNIEHEVANTSEQFFHVND